VSTLYPNRHDDDAPPRAGTIIWGLVAIVIGVLVLAVELTGLVLDPVLVVMALLVCTGVALIVGGILSMNRRA
jgi:predicted phage tail protein